MPDPRLMVHDGDSRSSLFEKLTADERRLLDQAVIDRQPAAYRAAYAMFGLAAKGVSFTAFYCYARRLRVQADLLQLAEMALPDAPDVAGALPDLLACRLFEAASDEASTPQALHRLADAWRIAAGTRLALERQAAMVEAARRQTQQRAEQGGEASQRGKRRPTATGGAAEVRASRLKLTRAIKSTAKAADGARRARRGAKERTEP